MLKLSNRSFSAMIAPAVIALMLPVIAACTQGTSALPSGSSEQAAVVNQPLVTGAPEITRITAKGGTKIYALVNGEPITTNDVRRRQAFVKLRRMKGNSREIASNELIDEAMKMQEARRIRVVVSDKEVDAAYARFAKNNKMPQSALTQVLNKRGVTQKGFKDYIKAQMSWQRAVGARVRAEANGKTRTTRNLQAWLPEVGKDANREKEYTLQQVVFVVPDTKNKSLLSARRNQANNFRRKMVGCSNAKQLATSLTNVSVIDRGRTLASQLPPRWKKDIESTPAGKVTPVKATQRGIEMLAVCKTREVIGQNNVSDQDLFSGKNFQKTASKTEKVYLAEIKKRAVIKRR